LRRDEWRVSCKTGSPHRPLEVRNRCGYRKVRRVEAIIVVAVVIIWGGVALELHASQPRNK